MNWMVAVAPASPVPHTPEPQPHPLGGRTGLDQLTEKLAMAERLGKELAHRDPRLLEKAALAGAMPALLNAGKGAAKMMMRSPTKALAVGGAGVGAASGALSDPGPGGSRLGGALSGAAMGAGLGFGASKIPGAGRVVQQQGSALSKGLRGMGRPPVIPGQQALPFPTKVASLMNAARSLAGNPLARRAAAGGALGAAAGGEDHHMGGALTGALLAGAGGPVARQAVSHPPTAAMHTPFLAPKLKPLVSQARPGAGGVPPAAAAQMKARAQAVRPPAPAATEFEAAETMGGFGPGKHVVDPRGATHIAPSSATQAGAHVPTSAGAGEEWHPQTKAGPMTRAGLGPQATNVTRVDPIARASMRALRAS